MGESAVFAVHNSRVRDIVIDAGISLDRRVQQLSGKLVSEEQLDMTAISALAGLLTSSFPVGPHVRKVDDDTRTVLQRALGRYFDADLTDYGALVYHAHLLISQLGDIETAAPERVTGLMRLCTDISSLAHPYVTIARTPPPFEHPHKKYARVE